MDGDEIKYTEPNKRVKNLLWLRRAAEKKGYANGGLMGEFYAESEFGLLGGGGNATPKQAVAPHKRSLPSPKTNTAKITQKFHLKIPVCNNKHLKKNIHLKKLYSVLSEF